MKKILVILMLAMMAPAAYGQTPVPSASDKIFFGKDKGKQILTAPEQQNQKLDQQNALLQAIVEELKKTNELLAKQDSGEKQTIALLKGFDAIMKKYQGGAAATVPQQ